ncbi:MAG TPA: methyltransferase domain-containing protein, partial [Chloroflexia bacterium]|nr:methyltransferase domain-containing protein [Chloroflexia bacterium]
EKVRQIYDKRAAEYDALMDRAWMDALRAGLFRQARGDVLEIGVGTGATFTHYPTDLTSLTALDISEGMLARARERAANLPFPVTLQMVDFQTLLFPDAAFDTVTSSLALCGIPDPARLFAEIRRVLRPGGRLLAVEHIRPPNPVLGLLADLANPINHHFVGCYLNRRTPDLLRAAGFTVTEGDRRFLRSVVTLVAMPEEPRGATA